MDAIDAFKNEREYFAANGNCKTTVAAMDWALGEIERLRATLREIADHAMDNATATRAEHALEQTTPRTYGALPSEGSTFGLSEQPRRPLKRSR